MIGPNHQDQDGHEVHFNKTIIRQFAAVFAKVGFLALLIIAVAVSGGLWLDEHFKTGPIALIVLLLASMPLTFFMIFRIVLSFAQKKQAPDETLLEQSIEEGKTEE
jgi:F0F1-type ATP synthase assembly protein I